MDISTIIPHIEALVFASDKPLTTLEITALINNAFGFIDDVAHLDQIEVAVEGIREKYSTEFYAFELKQSGGGWQFLTKPEFHKTVALINGEKFMKRLSTAALETLSIIAYKQPITKSEMESIRGVNCDYAVQKLLEKDLVIITGRNEDAVGKPLVYATSKSFMDYFGINSADELPQISEVLMEQLLNAESVTAIEAEKRAYEAVTSTEADADADTEMDDADGNPIDEQEEILLQPANALEAVTTSAGEDASTTDAADNFTELEAMPGPDKPEEEDQQLQP